MSYLILSAIFLSSFLRYILIYNAFFFSCRCLKSDGDIDWERISQTMKEFGRSFEERKEAVLNSSVDGDLPQPRLWTPIYGK